MRHEHILADIISRGELLGASDALPPAVDLNGVKYVNQLGSVATFEFNGNVVGGSYTSTVSSTGQSIAGPITGWVSGYVICWSVRWPTNPPTLTTWAGEFVQGSSAYDIDTLWYLVSQTKNPGDPKQFWTAVNAGSDLFKPQ